MDLGLRIGLQSGKVDVGNEARDSQRYEHESCIRCLSLIPLWAAIKPEVVKESEEYGADLFDLKVAVRVDQLIPLIIKEYEGHNEP